MRCSCSYGYPYVLDEFRFHLTLDRPAAAARPRGSEAVARAVLRCRVARADRGCGPLPVRSGAPRRAVFRILQRFPLTMRLSPWLCGASSPSAAAWACQLRSTRRKDRQLSPLNISSFGEPSHARSHRLDRRHSGVLHLPRLPQWTSVLVGVHHPVLSGDRLRCLLHAGDLPRLARASLRAPRGDGDRARIQPVGRAASAVSKSSPLAPV